MAVDEEVLTGILRAVVLSAFRQQEIGSGVYPRVMELLIDAIAVYVMPISNNPEVRPCQSNSPRN